MEGTKHVDIIYRIHYKVMKTNINIKALKFSPKSETLLMEPIPKHLQS